MRAWVWIVISPGYGDFDEVPSGGAFKTRRLAREQARSLNAPWIDSRDYKGRLIRPYRVRKLEVQ